MEIVFVDTNILIDYLKGDTKVISHNAKIYDCIIASTALIYDLSFATLNLKDFRYIDNLKLCQL